MDMENDINDDDDNDNDDNDNVDDDNNNEMDDDDNNEKDTKINNNNNDDNDDDNDQTTSVFTRSNFHHMQIGNDDRIKDKYANILETKYSKNRVIQTDKDNHDTI